MVNALTYQVSEVLIRRLRTLSEYYRRFFSTVNGNIKRNTENIKSLENLKFPFNIEGVYCSKDAFRKMVDDYSIKNHVQLSDETKKRIFEKIFDLQSFVHDHARELESINARKQYKKRETESLECMFKTAVIDTVKLEVIKNGDGITNMSVKQALLKEFELEKQIYPDNAGYESASEKYIKEKIEKAFKISSPMLPYTNVDVSKMRFLALNPVNSIKNKELEPDTAQTSKYYVDSTEAATNILIDHEFDEREIRLLSMDCNLCAEDLTMYSDGSRIEQYYSDRIKNVGVDRLYHRNNDGLDIVVNPHFDDRWNEEGFIPALNKIKREKDRKDVRKAFIYGLAYDNFILLDDDVHSDVDGNPRRTWYFTTRGVMGTVEIKKCGALIGNGYWNVYDSLFYNGVIKRSILTEAKKNIMAVKGYYQTDELLENILKSELVADLANTSDSVGSDFNIFDIFAKMRSSMSLNEWVLLFDGLLDTLWDYCGILFDNNGTNIDKATVRILKEIYRNSDIGKALDEQNVLNIDAQTFKEKYNDLLAKRFSEQ